MEDAGTVGKEMQKNASKAYPTLVMLYGPFQKDSQMAKPNYAFAKRQRDLAKKLKQEEKRQRKALAREEHTSRDNPPLPPDDKDTKPVDPS